jgi:chromate transporter
VGGGTSTLFLMRQELVARRHWLTERDFLEDWAFSKLSLGINLIGLTALISHRLAGVRGMAVALAALLVPSAAVTALMTAGYGAVQDQPVVRAALEGASPVIAGMTIGMGYVFGRQSMRRGWRSASEWTYWATVVGLGLFVGPPPIAVIATGIVAGFAVMRGEPRRAGPDPS